MRRGLRERGGRKTENQFMLNPTCHFRYFITPSGYKLRQWWHDTEQSPSFLESGEWRGIEAIDADDYRAYHAPTNESFVPIAP